MRTGEAKPSSAVDPLTRVNAESSTAWWTRGGGMRSATSKLLAAQLTTVREVGKQSSKELVKLPSLNICILVAGTHGGMRQAFVDQSYWHTSIAAYRHSHGRTPATAARPVPPRIMRTALNPLHQHHNRPSDRSVCSPLS
jgi:hypothetical protein